MPEQDEGRPPIGAQAALLTLGCVQNEAASCATTACSANALNSTAANPHVLTGAVVEFASFSDKYKVSWPAWSPPVPVSARNCLFQLPLPRVSSLPAIQHLPSLSKRAVLHPKLPVLASSAVCWRGYGAPHGHPPDPA